MKDKSLRQRALEEIEKVEWIPSAGKKRISSMIENRPDWCISRQRIWGVPITVFYCKKCGNIIADKEIFELIAQKVENYEWGADIWFEKSPKELLPENFKCPYCGSEEFEKEKDILDVWFDSGVSHACVLRTRNINKADMYLEGSDQHRGWFQSSLLESVASYGEAPYKIVLTHGFTVDELGRKMSKSLGNVVSPQEIIEKYGADILRLWVVSEDYTEDIKLGNKVLRAIAEDYRKIRNTLRFLLGNLYDFEPEKDRVEQEKLLELDRWIISHLQIVLDNLHREYSQYQFYRAFNILKNFINRELSAVYLDIVKDRLYTYAPNSLERRSCQTALWELLMALTTIIAPVLSFTAEEVWQNIRKIKKDLPESVFLSEIYKPNEDLIDKKLEEIYDNLLKLRYEVNRGLENARRKGIIRHPYEARVLISIENENLKKILEERKEWINIFFSVSELEIISKEDLEKLDIPVKLRGEELKELELGIDKAKGIKCPRCWLYFPEEKFKSLPDGQKVCEKCYKALKAIGLL